MLPRPSCLRLLRQPIFFALSLALAKAGKSSAARMAMMAITTSSSIRVNANSLRGSPDFTVKILSIGGRLRWFDRDEDLARPSGLDVIGHSRQTTGVQHQRIGKFGPQGGRDSQEVGRPHFYAGQAV